MSKKDNRRDYKVPNITFGVAYEFNYSIDDLKNWLQIQFYKNPKTGEDMHWSNYGKNGWIIDYIMPLENFDLSDERQFKVAYHWFNLRPIWAYERSNQEEI